MLTVCLSQLIRPAIWPVALGDRLRCTAEGGRPEDLEPAPNHQFYSMRWRCAHGLS